MNGTKVYMKTFRVEKINLVGNIKAENKTGIMEVSLGSLVEISK